MYSNQYYSQLFQYYTNPYLIQPYCYPSYCQNSIITPSYQSSQFFKSQQVPKSQECGQIEKPRQEIVQKKCIKQKKKRVIGRKYACYGKNKNIRNIIPNLSRKLFSFLVSLESRRYLDKMFPEANKIEIKQYYEFLNNEKNRLNFYIGNNDLKRIWFSTEINEKYVKYTRILSYYFLNNCCVSSILLSKKMKNSLKLQHMKYRRKILNILNGKKAKHQ